MTSALSAAFHHFVATSRANRAARAEHALLVSELSAYSSQSQRAEMDAILSRFPDSETHRAWNEVGATTPQLAYSHH